MVLLLKLSSALFLSFIATGTLAASSKSALTSSSKPALTTSTKSAKSKSSKVASTSTLVTSTVKTSVASTTKSSSSSSPSGILYVPGCPPITTSTYTSYVVATQKNIATVTSISTPFTRVTSTVTSTTDVTIGVYPNTSQVHYTFSTSITITVSKAKATITVPTASGFTPVQCEPAYHNPTSTSYFSTYTDTTPHTIVIPAPTSTSTTTVITYSYTSTSTITNTQLVLYTYYDTLTVTSTRADPTSTVYAACVTNNFTPKLPNGNYIGRVGASGQTFGSTVPAVDAIDCCAQCQASSNCTGSSYSTYYKYYPCQLYIKSTDFNQTACDPRTIGKQAYYFDPNPVISISNSACGQYVFAD